MDSSWCTGRLTYSAIVGYRQNLICIANYVLNRVMITNCKRVRAVCTGTKQIGCVEHQCRLTQNEAVRTAADNQVVRLAGARVLQRQQRPVARRPALAHLRRRFARLRQSDCLHTRTNKRDEKNML